MFNTDRQLKIDAKAQDRLREWFAERGNSGSLNISCVGLGDSDVDYHLIPNAEQVKILGAPYNVQRIKHHLIYEGSASNLTGELSLYARYIASNQNVQSLYGYPPSQNFQSGIVPPNLSNGFEVEQVTFADSPYQREGFIIYPQSIPDNYTDDNNNQLRLIEPYQIQTTDLPQPIEITNVTDTGVFPIEITTASAHGLSVGDTIGINEVQGNTAANGFHEVGTVPSSNQFTIPNTIANGDYITGGKVITWEIQHDEINNTFMIAKSKVPLQGSTGTISIIGLITGIETTLKFNY